MRRETGEADEVAEELGADGPEIAISAGHQLGRRSGQEAIGREMRAQDVERVLTHDGGGLREGGHRVSRRLQRRISASIAAFQRSACRRRFKREASVPR